MPATQKRRVKKKKSNATQSQSGSKQSKPEPHKLCIHASNNFYKSPSPSSIQSPATSCRIRKKSPHWLRDNGGVDRLFPQFLNVNKTDKMADKKKNPTVPYISPYRSTGLSAKEKSYIIGSCESKSNRYSYLKKTASDAKKKNKIFSVYGNCNAVRTALLERGWVEKIPPNKMNLKKLRNGTLSNKTEIHSELERLLLSNLVDRCVPNFVWRCTENHFETTIDMNNDVVTIVNKLKLDAMWTTKQGLCISMKRNNWFYIEDVAEVITPRTYDSIDSGEIEAFVRDYRITACTSLLKWLLSMISNDRPVFVKTGQVSLNLIIFALNRCKEYIFRKQHKDIDGDISNVSVGQWNAFLKKYYRIIAKEAFFQPDVNNKVPVYMGFANYLLNEIHRYRPQLSCEGCHDIWIIKPAHCSRGRGIRLASKHAVIMNLLSKANSKYVIQKYIEEPLLIHETKFDIRQYYLVTSTYPLIIWMYQDCYLKFSSQKYSLINYHESIHLTNNAVQRHYKNCTDRHADLPENNMWDLDTYKDYLKRIGKHNVWDNLIYPGMRKSIISIMLSGQDSLSVSKNRFELYGCDFILDKDYRPWLIEINSCPDLHHTTQVTARICPAVVADIIKVVIDYAADPGCSTGNFENIYRQPMTIPRYCSAVDLAIRGYALPLDYFYRGSVKINDYLYFDGMENQHDIKEALKNLKKCYESDVMVEPDRDNDEENFGESQNSCEHRTLSENDLDVTATVINEQLEDIFDKITRITTDNSKSLLKLDSSKSLARSMKTSLCSLKIKAEKIFNNLKIQSHSDHGIASNAVLKEKRRPKANAYHFDNIKKIIFGSKTKKSSHPKKANVKPPNDANQFCNDTLIQATNKLIEFLDKKEKEYLHS